MMVHSITLWPVPVLLPGRTHPAKAVVPHAAIVGAKPLPVREAAGFVFCLWSLPQHQRHRLCCSCCGAFSRLQPVNAGTGKELCGATTRGQKTARPSSARWRRHVALAACGPTHWDVVSTLQASRIILQASTVPSCSTRTRPRTVSLFARGAVPSMLL